MTLLFVKDKGGKLSYLFIRFLKTWILGIDDPTVTEEEVKTWVGPYRGIGTFLEMWLVVKD